MNKDKQLDQVIALPQGEQASALFNLTARLRARPTLKDPQQFLKRAFLSLAVAGVVPATAHLLRANNLINPIPVEGVRFDGNLGPVRVIKQGQFSPYVPVVHSVKVAIDAWKATPMAIDQAQMNAQAYFTHASQTGQTANGCIIRSYAKPWSSSRVYIGEDNPHNPTIMNRDLLDFVIPAHELNHCLYNIEDGVNIRREQDFDGQYFSSVMETAGDLGMILLYAQKTGHFGAFEDMLRLERRASINAKHQDHTTVWALDVILKDIDPQSMVRKDVPEIAALVRERMAQHFEHDGFLINPREPGSIVTPAMRAIQQEIVAQRWLAMERKGEGCPTPQVKLLVEHLRDDILQSLGNNHRRYLGDLDKNEQQVMAQRTRSFVDDLGLQYTPFPNDTNIAPSRHEVSSKDLPF